MNENLNDHRISDLIHHHTAVFGEPLDGQLRKLCEIMSYDRLCDWFDQHKSLPPEQLRERVAVKLEELALDAGERQVE
jgi:hypothetical protein